MRVICLKQSHFAVRTDSSPVLRKLTLLSVISFCVCAISIYKGPVGPFVMDVCKRERLRETVHIRVCVCVKREGAVERSISEYSSALNEVSFLP